jgi:hypothetical protein
MIQDYWSPTLGRPTLDNSPQQNLDLTNATEANGFTTLEFNRKADTGDTATDRPLKV